MAGDEIESVVKNLGVTESVFLPFSKLPKSLPEWIASRPPNGFYWLTQRVISSRTKNGFQERCFCYISGVGIDFFLVSKDCFRFWLEGKMFADFRWIGPIETPPIGETK